MAHILTLAGSPSAPSRSAALMAYAKARLENAGHTVDAVVIRDLDATELLHARADGPSLAPALAKVVAARGIVMATPVYKAAYSGVLKVFLDALPQNGLGGKVVLPIVSGAAPTHYLALDFALKPVLAALGAGRILAGIYLIDSQYEYKEGLRFTAPDIGAKYDAALDEFAAAL
jgi:FMN reductase